MFDNRDNETSGKSALTTGNNELGFLPKAALAGFTILGGLGLAMHRLSELKHSDPAYDSARIIKNGGLANLSIDQLLERQAVLYRDSNHSLSLLDEYRLIERVRWLQNSVSSALNREWEINQKQIEHLESMKSVDDLDLKVWKIRQEMLAGRIDDMNRAALRVLDVWTDKRIVS